MNNTVAEEKKRSGKRREVRVSDQERMESVGGSRVELHWAIMDLDLAGRARNPRNVTAWFLAWLFTPEISPVCVTALGPLVSVDSIATTRYVTT